MLQEADGRDAWQKKGIAMGFDYFYEEQSQQFAFYRIPKVLFTDARFQGISTEGKVLYVMEQGVLCKLKKGSLKR